MTTIGSLFSGYSGLDRAVESVTGGRTIWRSDIDPGACKILAHHWPAVPNLGDISAVDWSRVQPVDIITGGFPCQDVSMAGRRAGLTAGTRSGLWAMMAAAIDNLHPSLVVAENVRGLLSAAADSDVESCPWCVGDVSGEPPLRALGAVLGDLADIGYDAAWHGLTASSVGAPHGRFRIFIVAWPQSGDAHSINRQGRPTPGLEWEEGSQAGPAADTHVGGRSGRAGELRSGRRGQPAYGSNLPGPEPEQQRPDEPTDPLLFLPPQDALVRGSAETYGRCGEGHGYGCSAWGIYAQAIHRWEICLSRVAPAPTEPTAKGRRRLSARAVEFMMGLPDGHVTDVPGLTRNEQLKALGNGVVPQQAEAALRVLLNALAVAA